MNLQDMGMSKKYLFFECLQKNLTAYILVYIKIRNISDIIIEEILNCKFLFDKNGSEEVETSYKAF